ncbi:MAG: TIGR02996 domain-containing protein [Kofleriaceae bacterium]
MAKPKKPKPPVPTEPKPEEARFLATILANPDDKKARTIYADLLQDRGDPRGELIALQCARADLADDDPRVAELDESIAALLKKHKKTWTAFGENKGARWEYRRGFVEKLSINAKDLLANAAQIFAAEPLEELNVWKIDESPSERGRSKLAPILELPLHRIKRLSLARCDLTEDDYAALARATTLGNVELLDLTNGGSVSSPVTPLAKATSLPKLRELRLTGAMIGDDQLAALARSSTLRMSRLILQRNDLTAAGATSLATATWAPQLVHLDLSSNEMIQDEGLEALATSSHLTALETLVLSYVGLYQRAADLILASPVCARLKLLDVSNNMSAADLARLRAVFGDRLLPRA